MRQFRALLLAIVSLCGAGVVPVLTLGTQPATAATPGVSYIAGSPSLATITNGTSAAPWNEAQGDPASPAYTSQSPGTLLPTYTPGGTETSSGASAEPNVAVYPGAGSGTDGVAPYPSGVVGTPGPLSGYCGTGNNAAASIGSPARQPAGTTLPLAPAYFPHIVRNADGSLTGYFDYRPKDANEAIVAARSTDDGHDWIYEGEALSQNGSYCPTSDVNDDGQGHPNVISIGGTSRLYTLERAAGDNIGVGMLVHTLTPTAANPLNGLPATEKTGVDPDDFASAPVTVAHTGSTPVTISFSNPVGTGLEQLVAGGFVDLTQAPIPTASSIINCTGVGASSLTGCTTAALGGITVSSGDLIEQVLATIASNLAASAPATGCAPGSTTATLSGGGALPCDVPTGPNTTNGDGGLEGFGITVTNANNLSMAIFNADAPNRAYIDGVPVYCVQSNAFPTNKIENCTTGGTGTPLTVNTGDPVTSDPIVPASAQQTNGLVAPDGIVGVLPSYPGAPAGSTAVMYTEKVLNYFIVGFTGSKTTFSANMSIPFTVFPGTASASLGTGPTYTVTIGDGTTNAFVQETCSGFNSVTSTLTECNGGTVGHTITKNSYIGAPGAATVSAATLAQTGEGSATNAQKLLKNNEDLTVLRVAYTTDGVNFSTAGLANGGVISGASNGASSYSDINNPSATASPSNLNAYNTAGAALATEMRWVGSAGSIITNPDGSYGMFLSGAWAADGDSDAFNQIFYTTSTDGQHWSIPVDVISTDYTFSASVAQDNALSHGVDQPLEISAYYSGRTYGPSVVQNVDGTLSMIFAGYRIPKTISSAGTVLGTNFSVLYTIGATDPALYRNILVTTLTPSTSPLASTTTTVTSSDGGAATNGTSVTYIATVAPQFSGAIDPSGTVSFSDNGTPIPGCLTEAITVGAMAASASCTTQSPAGRDEITAIYGGDANYSPSTGSFTDLVAGFAPGGGSFVIGDQAGAVGKTVTFWGSQWAKDNATSTGSSVSSFKGFANNTSADACGATWTTGPGNSSSPPSGPLPTYMAVLVTSTYAKSGSQISGNVTHIDIVKTDPGYASDPGGAGTGTVVAQVC